MFILRKSNVNTGIESSNQLEVSEFQKNKKILVSNFLTQVTHINMLVSNELFTDRLYIQLWVTYYETYNKTESM